MTKRLTICDLFHGDESCECGCHVDCDRPATAEDVKAAGR